MQHPHPQSAAAAGPRSATPRARLARRLVSLLLPLLLPLAGLGLPAAATAQDGRPVAFTNARLLTMAGAPIERGTLVVRAGKIEALGADVAAPAGAIVVDCEGGTVMPGFVNAFSRAGFERQAAPTPRTRGRRGGRGRGEPTQRSDRSDAKNSAATKVVQAIDPRQDVFGEVLRAGVTTLALTPQGNGLPGLGAILRPDGRRLDELTVDDDAFVFVGMHADAATKKLLKEAFAKAAKVVEERKKPKPAPAAETAAKADQPAEAKPDQPAGDGSGKDDPKPQPEPKPDPEPKPKPEPEPKPDPEPKPAPKPGSGDGGRPQGGGGRPPRGGDRTEKKDPDIEVLADLLEGKRRAFVQIDSASELLHWQHATGGELEFPRTLVVERHDNRQGTLDVVLDLVKQTKAAVLLPPLLTTEPTTRIVVNPARLLHDAGVEIGFHLTTDNPRATPRQGAEQLRFHLMELVRSGLPADVALRGVTVVPARMLGVEEQTGTLAVGKQADLLVLSGDPLDPASQLRSVWLRGVRVPPQAP